MKNKYLSKFCVCSLLLLSFIFSGCLQHDPVTGRSRLSLVSSTSLNKMSFQQYDKLIKKHGLSTDPVKSAMVKKVGLDIKDAVEKYCYELGIGERLKNYKWEFSLIENDQINAFCMPGGKVGIYTGILKITEDEDGLAVVIAHEVAHAIAEHSRERMSQAMLISMGGMALGKAMEKKEGKSGAVFLGLYGIGTSVGFMLPNSRKQEYEADKLGLKFMAMAGYNPSAAVSLWQRMSKTGKKKPPEFLSTHPADQSRIEEIRKMLPGAMKIYNNSGEIKSDKKNNFSGKSVQNKTSQNSVPVNVKLKKAREENIMLKKKLGLEKGR
ncbi:MAG: M48 family metallopeptidase [Planctomycetota bacterium]|jgi:predicted Zn-dependent protease